MARRMRLLAEITSTRGDGDVAHLHELTLKAMRATDADAAGLSIWVPEFERLRTLVNVGVFDDGPSPFPDEEDYPLREWGRSQAIEDCLGRVYWRGQPAADAVSQQYLSYLVDWGVDSAMDLPVLVDGAVWGELTVARTADHPAYGLDDMWWAAAVASQVGAAIGSALHLRTLHRMATTDQLTGLPNRWAFDEQARRLFAAGVRQRSVVLAVLDLNGLKAVNDSRGHEAGDRLLIGFGELLREVGAELTGSLVARLGGDEFCLLTGEHAADAVEQALRRLLARAADDLGCTAACGIAEHSPSTPVDGVSELLRLADEAQYRAKHGRSPVPLLSVRDDQALRGSVARATGAPLDDTRPLAPVTELRQRRRRSFRDRLTPPR
ncbi:MAG: sensor domain-containing diguanylate cyclase [Actinomycetes bacterium]